MENNKLPLGFENKSTQEVTFKQVKTNAAPRHSMRRGPGGMAQAMEKPKDIKGTVSRLSNYFRRSLRLFIALVAVVIVVTLTSLVSPAVQGSAIDAIKDKNWDILFSLCIWLAISYGVHVVFSLFQSLLSARLSQSIVKNLRYDLFKKIDNLSIGYLDTHSNGDVMSRITNDVDSISNTVFQSLASLISGVLTIIGTIAIMFWYCWQLTLITMFSVLLTVVVTKKMSKKMRTVFRKRSKVLGILNGEAEEMITGYKTLVAYNKQDYIVDEFNGISEELTREGIRSEILGGSMGPIMNSISNLSFVIVAAFGGYFAYTGLITIGVISAFIIYARQFSRPINEIAQLYGALQTAIAGAERVFELMDNPDEDNSGHISMSGTKGEIRFENVNFSYVPGKQVLYDFNLDVKPGEKIALVGATGSGKTTVVNLLMRFYHIDSGKILIDGNDIMDISRDELRRNTAIVLQDTVLFSDTIANNIKYSNSEASDEEVARAAKMANIDSYIQRLPEKYQTFLKRAGSSLSQGQRQLLTIARAILADPKILILDEATSSVDTRTERNIQEAMLNLMKNRTSLIIAHRLSTIQDADKIVVMDGGRVVEMGNHHELLEKKGKYYSLYMTQFAGSEI